MARSKYPLVRKSIVAVLDMIGMDLACLHARLHPGLRSSAKFESFELLNHARKCVETAKKIARLSDVATIHDLMRETLK